MLVFVVSKGERGEGSVVRGVYKTLDKARIAAAKVRDLYPNAKWARDPDMPADVEWWDDAGGCDHVFIEPHKVQ